MPLLVKSSKEMKAAYHFKSVSVNLLDSNQTPFEIDLTDEISGSILIDHVCLLLGGVFERDFFGLRYVYRGEEKRWLDKGRNVCRQMIKANTTTLSLRVCHYPSNPANNIMQDLVRYFFYLQLRRDLFSGNLIVKEEPLSKLIALVIQAECGDIVEPTQTEILALVTDLNVVANIANRMIDLVCRVMVTLTGLDPKEAEKQFLGIVSQLESYGVEPYCVLDQTGEELFLAMNHQGICTFSGEKRTHIFYWENISKMMFVKKSFRFDVNIDDKRRLGFKFGSENLAKEFWKWALDRQSFMTLNRSSDAKKMKSNSAIFSKKVTHKFSGRSLRELTLSCNTLDSIPQPPIVRTRNPTMSRCDSSRGISQQNTNIDRKDSKSNMYTTLPRRSEPNKDFSVQFIDFEIRCEDKCDLVTPILSEECLQTSCKHIEEDNVLKEYESSAVVGDTKEEILESEESIMVQSLFANIDDIIEKDTEADQLRERRIARDLNIEESKKVNGAIGSPNSDVDNGADSMFFIKLVIYTSLILLVVTIIGLIGYYYYRSATIAHIQRRHKYSSDWDNNNNNNIDLESLKKFLL